MGWLVDEPSLRGKFFVFEDRSDAGGLLADKLRNYNRREDCLVVAIPAGGVEVTVPLCMKLNVKFDLAVTRKIHILWNREAGFGAVTWRGSVYINWNLLASLGLSEEEVRRCIDEEKEAIEKRLRTFRGSAPPLNVEGKVAIIVDDGMASGFSMLATVKELKNIGAREVIVATPTGSISAVELVKPHADGIICLNIRGTPFAVADAYRKWYDLTDENVLSLLKKAGDLYIARGPHLETAKSP